MDCHACGREVRLAAGERVGFRDVCPGCGADLHTCVHCAHRDPSAYNGCREPGAERVLDAESANRCDWFSPAAAANAATGSGDAREQARADLDALFKK
ncbi:MAG: hypothetical protein ACQGVC_04675 [Myxococcota bacterium]